MASLTDMLRAKCCGIFISRTSSVPMSLPKKTISMPGPQTRFLQQRRQWRACPGGVADGPVRNGNPLLPEHSSVNVTSWRGRA